MDTRFITSNVSLEVQDRVWKNVQLVKSDNPEMQSGISTFDVNNSGQIAIGLSNKKINIYDTDGQFQYGYSFSTAGDYEMEWDKQNLIIYLVRSDIALKVDSEGNYLELESIDNSIENNSYWNYLERKTSQTSGGNYYEVNNKKGINIFATNYSRLVKTDSNGIETIIYDVSKTKMASQVTIILLVIGLITITTLIIIEGWKDKTVK
jgi:hypothetical protein